MGRENRDLIFSDESISRHQATLKMHDGKFILCDDGSTHGTNVEFYDTPNEAAARAKSEQKLVFVLHLSGIFEDPRFT